MSKIFISYRRDDSAGYAGRIYDRLASHFGEDNIFMDIDTMGPGVDFVEEIDRAVASCDVFIAVMGKQWIDIRDGEGNRRLDNPHDFVRLEVAAALDRGILVIPALVREANMPKPTDLPDGLTALTRRNAVQISDHNFHHDLTKLINSLDVALSSQEKPDTQSLNDHNRITAPPQPDNRDQNTAALPAQPDLISLIRLALTWLFIPGVIASLTVSFTGGNSESEYGGVFWGILVLSLAVFCFKVISKYGKPTSSKFVFAFRFLSLFILIAFLWFVTLLVFVLASGTENETAGTAVFAVTNAAGFFSEIIFTPPIIKGLLGRGIL